MDPQNCTPVTTVEHGRLHQQRQRDCDRIAELRVVLITTKSALATTAAVLEAEEPMYRNTIRRLREQIAEADACLNGTDALEAFYEQRDQKRALKAVA
jgi:hypothetical protein